MLDESNRQRAMRREVRESRRSAVLVADSRSKLGAWQARLTRLAGIDALAKSPEKLASVRSEAASLARSIGEESERLQQAIGDDANLLANSTVRDVQRALTQAQAAAAWLAQAAGDSSDAPGAPPSK